MTALAPTDRVKIYNASGLLIPPRSVVVATSVVTDQSTSGSSSSSSSSSGSGSSSSSSSGYVPPNPQTDGGRDSTSYTIVTQYSGQAGPIMITGPETIRPQSYGSAYYDQFIYCSIDPAAPNPASGDIWGPIAGSWTLGTSGKGFVCQGYSTNGGNPKRAMFYRVPQTASGSSSGGGGCGCCNCFNCITALQAIVGGCSGAPNGAADQYTLPTGVWPFSDSGGTSTNTTYTYGSASCGSSSSSSSSSSAGSGCSWYSCPITLCQPASSSSSSSSGGTCGIYQTRCDFSLVGGLTQISISIVFVSGTDWSGIGS